MNKWLDWRGQTVVLIASGPSVTQEQCEMVREWRQAGGGRVGVVNTTWESAPWADVLYGCSKWWRHNHELVAKKYGGEVWTEGKDEALSYGLNHIRSEDGEGLSKDPTVVFRGGGFKSSGNSGYQLINLVYHWGVTRIVLLGYDMKMDGKKKNHHRPHAHQIASPYSSWIPQFYPLAMHLEEAGVKVINATPGSAITAFPRAELGEVLHARPMLAA